MKNQQLATAERTINDMTGWMATTRRENTDEWMMDLAEHLNNVLEYLGDSDRVFYDLRSGMIQKNVHN